MRVNVYAEEMTERFEIVEKTTPDGTFTGLRFFLELPVTVPHPSGGGNTVFKGPFRHHAGDDDSAAVTFWGKQDLRLVLRAALAKLDGYYENRPTGADTESAPMRSGAEYITLERLRQLSSENFTGQHDSDHIRGELALAAACYAKDGSVFQASPEGKVPSLWPWDAQWWKPKTAIRDLIRAGALCAAEIDRRLCMGTGEREEAEKQVGGAP